MIPVNRLEHLAFDQKIFSQPLDAAVPQPECLIRERNPCSSNRGMGSGPPEKLWSDVGRNPADDAAF